MNKLALALVLALAAGAAAAAQTSPAPPVAHMSPAPARTHRLCTLTRCGHCPKGEWDCAGRCIPKNRACSPF